MTGLEKGSVQMLPSLPGVTLQFGPRLLLNARHYHSCITSLTVSYTKRTKALEDFCKPELCHRIWVLLEGAQMLGFPLVANLMKCSSSGELPSKHRD